MSRIRPILFNTDMVKAILENKKTVTRRIVKPQPKKDMKYKLGYCTDGDRREIGKFGFGSHECGGNILYAKPPALVGDILYVRETIWQKTSCYLDIDGETKPTFCNEFKYAASDEEPEVGWNYSWAKRPSIHMPKAAARIWLKVTDVRVEQLKDITEQQAIKEGYTDDIEYALGHTAAWHFIEDFKNIYPDCTDDSWVWVIEFEQCEKPISEV